MNKELSLASQGDCGRYWLLNGYRDYKGIDKGLNGGTALWVVLGVM